jgi:hypothetical protein
MKQFYITSRVNIVQCFNQRTGKWYAHVLSADGDDIEIDENPRAAMLDKDGRPTHVFLGIPHEKPEEIVVDPKPVIGPIEPGEVRRAR